MHFIHLVLRFAHRFFSEPPCFFAFFLSAQQAMFGRSPVIFKDFPVHSFLGIVLECSYELKFVFRKNPNFLASFVHEVIYLDSQRCTCSNRLDKPEISLPFLVDGNVICLVPVVNTICDPVKLYYILYCPSPPQHSFLPELSRYHVL